jgi:hypothetical protein
LLFFICKLLRVEILFVVLFPGFLKVDFVRYLCAPDEGESELVNDLLLCEIFFMIRLNLGLCI